MESGIPAFSKTSASLCKTTFCALKAVKVLVLAIFHLSVKTVSRSTGRSAVAAAAYRTGERLTNARDEVTHDYTRRSGVAATVLLVPDGSGGLAMLDGRDGTAERERLWNAAEASEKRVNSTVAREYELTLPAELDEAGRRDLALGFAREVVSRFGVAADVAIHAPSRDGDQRHHHAHILTTTRRMEANGALGDKTRELDDRKTGPAHVEALRALWAVQVNAALERIQSEARVDHRSHARRGLTAIPSITMGAAATALERRAQREHDKRDGGPDVLPPVTDRGRRQAEIAAANAAAERARADADRAAREQAELERQAEAAKVAAARVEADRVAREQAAREQRAEAARAAREQQAAVAQAARKQAERERQAEAARTAQEAARMAQEAARKAVERPLEAARAADPDRERWRTMPMAALRSEIETLRPLSAAAAAKLLPAVQAERAAVDKALMAASRATGKASEAGWTAHRLEQEIATIRAEPGQIAKLAVWLHDRKLRQNAALAQREAALAQERQRRAQALEARARHQAAAAVAEVREQAVEAAGLPAVEDGLRLARARYEAALAVLQERTQEVEGAPEPFEPPAPAPDTWPARRELLVEARRLPERLTDNFERAGLLIPQPRGFLLAMRHATGRGIVGAESYDEEGLFLGLFRRSRRDQGGVRLSRGIAGQPRDVILAETGLDALSLHELIPSDSEREQVFISTAGPQWPVSWLRELMTRGARLFVAYNDTPTSEHAAAAILAQYPTTSARRWRPKAATWSEHLVAVRAAEDARTVREADEPKPDDELDLSDDTSIKGGRL